MNKIFFVIFLIFSVIILNVGLNKNENVPNNIQENNIQENDTLSDNTFTQTDSNIEYDMQSISFFAMDTYITLSACGEFAQKTLLESKQVVLDLEKKISQSNSNSDIYKLNNSNGQPVQVDSYIYSIVELLIDYSILTNGYFDPTIASITNLWNINAEPNSIPAQNEIDLALSSVSYSNIILLDDNYIQLINNATIELGAIGKGIATDLINQIYLENSIENGIISLSGNIYLFGQKDVDTLWTVGISDPEYPNLQNIAVKLADISVVTAGAYERYFIYNDEIYHHIFDISTGYPTNKDITSVTIISKNSTLADVFSTAIFAMGFDTAIEFLTDFPDIDAIIINEDNQVFITDNIIDSTILTEKYLTY